MFYLQKNIHLVTLSLKGLAELLSINELNILLCPGVHFIIY